MLCVGEKFSLEECLHLRSPAVNFTVNKHLQYIKIACARIRLGIPADL